jgi:hypothetical protein
MVMALFQRHADAVVVELTWRRVVELDDIEWVTVRSQSPPPDTARNVRVHSEQHFENVQIGINPNGSPENMMESRSRRVYEFELERWRRGRVIAEEGSDQSGVRWPEYKLGPNERVHKKSETYASVFALAGSGEERKAELDEETWRSLEKGSAYHLELGMLGHVHAVRPATG